MRGSCKMMFHRNSLITLSSVSDPPGRTPFPESNRTQKSPAPDKISPYKLLLWRGDDWYMTPKALVSGVIFNCVQCPNLTSISFTIMTLWLSSGQSLRKWHPYIPPPSRHKSRRHPSLFPPFPSSLYRPTVRFPFHLGQGRSMFFLARLTGSTGGCRPITRLAQTISCNILCWKYEGFAMGVWPQSLTIGDTLIFGLARLLFQQGHSSGCIWESSITFEHLIGGVYIGNM